MRIIITGKSSYIGVNICRFLNSRGHSAETVSVRDGIDDLELSNTDAVIHCAAIVHKNEKDFFDKYEEVNYALTIDLAKKAKSQGVRQFIFMSTMSVYSPSCGVISADTKPSPSTLYGKTKLNAETALKTLADDSFTVAIIRPPMVYGKDCPGNYQKLSALAKTMPIFPDTQNKKSMLYVENLAYFVCSLAENNTGGTFMPMDNKYVSTAYMAKTINKKISLSRLLGKIISLFKINIVKKAFGTLYYDDSCATKINYINFEKAIEHTEK